MVLAFPDTGAARNSATDLPRKNNRFRTLDQASGQFR